MMKQDQLEPSLMHRGLRSLVRCCLCPMLLGLVFFSGCWWRSDEPGRFQYRGTVTLAGKPCPLCELSFDPDSTKGGHGPGVLILAENGIYDTRSSKGIPPGAKTVRILGFDGIPTSDSSSGKIITKSGLQISVNLPASNAEQNFDIPADALLGN